MDKFSDIKQEPTGTTSDNERLVKPEPLRIPNTGPAGSPYQPTTTSQSAFAQIASIDPSAVSAQVWKDSLAKHESVSASPANSTPGGSGGAEEQSIGEIAQTRAQINNVARLQEFTDRMAHTFNTVPQGWSSAPSTTPQQAYGTTTAQQAAWGNAIPPVWNNAVRPAVWNNPIHGARPQMWTGNPVTGPPAIYGEAVLPPGYTGVHDVQMWNAARLPGMWNNPAVPQMHNAIRPTTTWNTTPTVSLSQASSTTTSPTTQPGSVSVNVAGTQFWTNLPSAQVSSTTQPQIFSSPATTQQPQSSQIWSNPTGAVAIAAGTMPTAAAGAPPTQVWVEAPVQTNTPPTTNPNSTHVATSSSSTATLASQQGQPVWISMAARAVQQQGLPVSQVLANTLTNNCVPITYQAVTTQANGAVALTAPLQHQQQHPVLIHQGQLQIKEEMGLGQPLDTQDGQAGTTPGKKKSKKRANSEKSGGKGKSKKAKAAAAAEAAAAAASAAATSLHAPDFGLSNTGTIDRSAINAGPVALDLQMKAEVPSTSGKKPGKDKPKKKKHKITCAVCSKTYGAPKVLFEHLMRHRGIKEFQCPKCDSAFFWMKDMTDHASKTHKHQLSPEENERYGSIRKRFSLQEEKPMTFTLTEHLPDGTTRVCEAKRSVGEPVGGKNTAELKCCACSKSFVEKRALLAHLMLHRNKQDFLCPECSLGHSHQWEVYRHLREGHFREATEADVDFLEQKRLQLGIRLVEKEFNVYTLYETAEGPGGGERECMLGDIPPRSSRRNCDAGQSVDTEDNELDLDFPPENKPRSKTHRNKETDPITCAECQKIFNCRRPLFEHLLRHRVIKDFHCPKCEATFAWYKDMRVHANRVHKYILNQQERDYFLNRQNRFSLRAIKGNSFTLSEKTEDGRSQDCILKKFVKDSQFSAASAAAAAASGAGGAHKEGVRCCVCYKSFADKKSLQKHLTRHRGMKDYACPECPSRFFYQWEVSPHVQEQHGRALSQLECDTLERIKEQSGLHVVVKHNNVYTLHESIPGTGTSRECAFVKKELYGAAACAHDNTMVPPPPPAHSAVGLFSSPVVFPSNACI